MTQPLLFISHKHSDNEIAQLLAEFVEAKSNAAVKVHLSSSADFKGPIYGPSLNGQLRKALWETDVLVLVYTSEEEGWDYCMWECGVATHPNSPNTNIVVFQCGSDVPAPFRDVLRVNVRNREDIKRFTNLFLRDPGFFPSRSEAIAGGLKDKYVEDAAQELYDNITKLLPDPDPRPDEWAAWPYMRIELPRAEADKLLQLDIGETERVKLSHEIVRQYAVIVNSSARAAQLFGQESIAKDAKFETLLATWKSKYPSADATWFDSCCEQIMMGASRGFPVIRLTPMKEVGGDSEFTPVLSRIRQVPFRRKVQFDIYFYNLSDPRAVPVASKMIRMGEFFYKKLGPVAPETINLMGLRKELEARGLSRVPIFDGEDHPLYIVHDSMIGKFLLNRLDAGENPRDLTLADLLSDAAMKKMFQDTFVVVKEQATLAEARDAMVARPDCRDVFVTKGGTHDEPVLGWLTNVDITRGS